MRFCNVSEPLPAPDLQIILVVTMQVKCPACNTLLNIPEHLAGKPVKCQCGKVFKINTQKNTVFAPKITATTQVTCQKCNKALNIPEELLGKTVKCSCGHQFVVPASSLIPPSLPGQVSSNKEIDLFSTLDLNKTPAKTFQQAGPLIRHKASSVNGPSTADQKPKKSHVADLLDQANNQLAADSFHHGNVQTSGRGEVLYIIGHGFMCVVWTAVIGTWCGCISPFILGMIARYFFSRDQDTLAYLYFSMAMLNILLPLIMMYAFEGFFDFLLNLAG